MKLNKVIPHGYRLVLTTLTDAQLAQCEAWVLLAAKVMLAEVCDDTTLKRLEAARCLMSGGDSEIRTEH